MAATKGHRNLSITQDKLVAREQVAKILPVCAFSGKTSSCPAENLGNSLPDPSAATATDTLSSQSQPLSDLWLSTRYLGTTKVTMIPFGRRHEIDESLRIAPGVLPVSDTACSPALCSRHAGGAALSPLSSLSAVPQSDHGQTVAVMARLRPERSIEDDSPARFALFELRRRWFIGGNRR